ncbi:MAG: hypothetical protein U0625_06985 [Phycisphaerales bacterium]
MPWYSWLLGGCGGLLLVAVGVFSVVFALDRRRTKRLCLRKLAPALAHHHLKLNRTSGNAEVLKLEFVSRTSRAQYGIVVVTINLCHLDTPNFDVSVRIGARQAWNEAVITVPMRVPADLEAALATVNERLLRLDLAPALNPGPSLIRF